MRTSVLVLVFILTGCKSGPDFKPPQEPVPDRYTEAAAEPGADAPDFWWKEFHDPLLDSLEEKVAHGNLDLKAAYLRIVEARLQVQSARAQGLPSLNAAASYNREQLGLAGILKSQHVGTGAPGSAEQGLISSLERPVNVYQLGFDASWELDLFGRVRRAVEAADAQALQAVEARSDLLVSMEAEVAQTYFQLRTNQALRHVARDEINAQRDVVELTVSREQHGLAGAADVATAQAQLASLESALPPYDQTVESARHALAVLTGQVPEDLDTELAGEGAVPKLPDTIPAGLPSTLARRRPDIREAEAALHAATAQVGVSVASLFPDISLSGTLGLRNLTPGYLFDWDSHFYTFGPTVSVPIFRGGALVANVRLSQAQAAESALNYRKTVLNALLEVEDGLSSLRQDALRIDSLQHALDFDQRALDINTDSYHHGLVTYITVLTLQIQTVQARQQLLQAQLAQSTDLVKLYKALGGGWQDSDASRS